MGVASRNSNNRLPVQHPAGIYRSRLIRIIHSSITQFPIGIVTPCEDFATRSQSHTVIAASSDGHHRFPSQHPTATYRHRCGFIFNGFITQLTLTIMAPREDLAIGGQRQTVVFACRDGHHRLASQRIGGKQLHWHSTTVVRPVAELTGRIVAPGKDLTLGGQRQTVISTCRDGHHRFASQHPACIYRRRHGFIGRGPVAQLPIAVETPGENLAIRAQCQAVG